MVGASSARVNRHMGHAGVSPGALPPGEIAVEAAIGVQQVADRAPLVEPGLHEGEQLGPRRLSLARYRRPPASATRRSSRSSTGLIVVSVAGTSSARVQPGPANVSGADRRHRRPSPPPGAGAPVLGQGLDHLAADTSVPNGSMTAIAGSPGPVHPVPPIDQVEGRRTGSLMELIAAHGGAAGPQFVDARMPPVLSTPPGTAWRGTGALGGKPAGQARGGGPPDDARRELVAADEVALVSTDRPTISPGQEVDPRHRAVPPAALRQQRQERVEIGHPIGVDPEQARLDGGRRIVASRRCRSGRCPARGPERVGVVVGRQRAAAPLGRPSISDSTWPPKSRWCDGPCRGCRRRSPRRR